MASSPLPASSSGGVNASMWANQPSPSSPAPNRGGWTQSGSGFRGSGRGRGGARGAPRGGGRGGRPPSISKGGPPARNPSNASPQTKPSTEQPKETPKETPVKVPAAPAGKPTATVSSKPPPSPATPSITQPPSSTSKGSGKPKQPSRKGSDQKPPRSKAPSVSESPAIPVTHSPALSTASTTASRNSGRRKRSNAKPPSTHTRKASVSTEPPVRTKLDRPPAIAIKDVPPHLAVTIPDTPSVDIKSSVNALVEHVRSVAMDRPNTPGSHIDWAGEEDDSLPDLDDWGVTSSTAGTADAGGSDAGASRIISPILEDTLKPLPSLEHCEPKNLLSQKSGEQEQDAANAANGTEGPTRASSVATETKSTVSSESSVAPNSSTSASSPRPATKAPLHPSLPPKPVDSLDVTPKRNGRRSEPVAKAKGEDTDVDAPLEQQAKVLPPIRVSLEDHNPSSKDSSPERGLGASIHAIPTSRSAPSDITMHTVPHRGGPFNPGHNRAHTVGARVPGHRHPFSTGIPDHASSDGERPRRGDHAYHARTQSTPPTGPGLHPRAPHASRPVITGDAISKLARTLGQTPLRREVASTAAVSNGAKDSAA